MSKHNTAEQGDSLAKAAMLRAFNTFAELTIAEMSAGDIRPERIGQCLAHVNPVICEDKTSRSNKAENLNDIEQSFENAVEHSDQPATDKCEFSTAQNYCSVTTQVNDYIDKRREQNGEEFDASLEAFKKQHDEKVDN
jgi:hypothetical protein